MNRLGRYWAKDISFICRLRYRGSDFQKMLFAKCKNLTLHKCENWWIQGPKWLVKSSRLAAANKRPDQRPQFCTFKVRNYHTWGEKIWNKYWIHFIFHHNLNNGRIWWYKIATQGYHYHGIPYLDIHNDVCLIKNTCTSHKQILVYIFTHM